MELQGIVEDILSNSDHEISLKSMGMVTRSLRVTGLLSAWLEIVSKRTGLTITDIIEYALISAASPTMDLSFVDMITLHKSKAIKQGKKWNSRRASALVREDIEAAILYGISKEAARAQWKEGLPKYESKSKGGRPLVIKL